MNVSDWQGQVSTLVARMRIQARKILAAQKAGKEREAERLRLQFRADTQRLIAMIRSAPPGAKIPPIPKEEK